MYVTLLCICGSTPPPCSTPSAPPLGLDRFLLRGGMFVLTICLLLPPYFASMLLHMSAPFSLMLSQSGLALTVQMMYVR